MIKYVPEDTSVVFLEIPDEICCAINISNCPHRCDGCHSQYLRKDIGDELNKDVIDQSSHLVRHLHACKSQYHE